ncbi:MAG: hypothetical protein QOG49_500 [Frankiaceae bacterium]|nr:hypothetical protein [Frankiaceae bacterium]
MLFYRRRAVALAAVVLVTAALPACTHKKKTAAAVAATSAAASSAASSASASPSESAGETPTPAPAASPSASASASTAPRKAAPVAVGHPFTGGKEPIGPVVAVKVNNNSAGMPQSGLDQADVIYEELIEGGETRLCAIFSTKRPTLVGPIRSARETDIELLAEYGKIAIAFSGANKLMLRVVKRANLVDARWDAVPSAYVELKNGRHAPYRVHASIPKLIAQAPGANAKDIGFRFGSSHSPSSAATKVVIPWIGVTNTVRYDKASRRWTVYYGNRRQVTVDNLVVQYVKVQRTGFTDQAGNYTPLARTLGSGKVMVFRDGRAVDGTWHRQFMKSPTVMLDSKRQKLLLRPGTTFIMLVPNTNRISYG